MDALSDLDLAGLSYSLTGRVNSLMQAFAAMPEDVDTLRRMNAVFNMVQTLPFQPHLWKVQNLFYGLMQTLYPTLVARSDRRTQEWVREFTQLGEKLGLTLQNDWHSRRVAWSKEPVPFGPISRQKRVTPTGQLHRRASRHRGNA